MKENFYDLMESPLGELLLVSNGTDLTGLYMGSDVEAYKKPQNTKESWIKKPEIFKEARNQLKEYFTGKRSVFDLSIHYDGTVFQNQVWDELRKIPYASTVTYGELAARIGKPGASRAVGGANNKNPISIIIPCHRVIGASGDLVGYGGGLEKKRWLLEHEALNRKI